MIEKSISVVSSKTLLTVFGTCDQHLRKLRDGLNVGISAQDGQIHIRGEADAVARATHAIEQLQACAQQHGDLAPDDVDRVLAEIATGQATSPSAPIVVYNGREVRSRTPGQAKYIEAVRRNNLVLCAGPAGTGKTYLAVALAVAALREERVRK
ncbi:MAG: PhoH family protein, partial [Pirellulales bacterium]|nr:PhoH family protein [Pirellulales bacterium]